MYGREKTKLWVEIFNSNPLCLLQRLAPAIQHGSQTPPGPQVGHSYRLTAGLGDIPTSNPSVVRALDWGPT